MKTLLSLDSATVAKLRSVRRTSKMPVRGSFFALDRAWDRKKIATHVRVLGPVTKVPNPYRAGTELELISPVQRQYFVGLVENVVQVELQNVGRIFSDGRYIRPTKHSEPVIQYLVKYSNRERYVPVFGSYEHVEPIG